MKKGKSSVSPLAGNREIWRANRSPCIPTIIRACITAQIISTKMCVSWHSICTSGYGCEGKAREYRLDSVDTNSSSLRVLRHRFLPWGSQGDQPLPGLESPYSASSRRGDLDLRLCKNECRNSSASTGRRDACLGPSNAIRFCSPMSCGEIPRLNPTWASLK